MSSRDTYLQSVRGLRRNFVRADRDSRYAVVLLWSVPVLTISMIQALNRGWFDSMERPVFHLINGLPGFLGPPFYVITQLGSFGSVFIWSAAAWYFVSRRAGIIVAVADFLGWLLAKVVKVIVHRGRPQDLLRSVNLFHHQLYSGYGFPSGHATFSATGATVLYYQIRPRYRKYVLLIVLLVGLSRMYLGAHFPLDVVGGWALGATIGALVSLLVGSEPRVMSMRTIKKVLNRSALQTKSIRRLDSDARGSRPIQIETKDGVLLFGKIIGQREHAADWLFKQYRFFRYKNLAAEEPYANARRNVELESFATMWAKRAGVRVPDIRGIYKLGTSWLLVQERIDARPLPACKKLSQASLEDVWRQVKKLHEGNIAHRDLRAANIMIDRSGKAWLIDFGFAEAAPRPHRMSMDNAELLMSMSLQVCVDTTLKAAWKVLGSDVLQAALPYLQKPVFSVATSRSLRRNKHVLPDLRGRLRDMLPERDEARPVDIERLNIKKLIGLVALAIFIYLVLPQFKKFSGDLDALRHAAYWWALPALVFSGLTYVLAGSVYTILAQVPLRLRDASLVQLAASFVSKVMPAGLGGTTLNARYLTRSGLATSEASAVIAGQNVISVLTFVLPLSALLLGAGGSVTGMFHLHVPKHLVYLTLAVVIVTAVVLSLNRKLRRRLHDFLLNTLKSLQELTTSPLSIGLAAAASFAMTLSYIACLYACVLAFRVHLSLLDVVIVYASGIVVKSAVPSPGGVGPIEIALVSAVLGYGVSTAPAYAVVILYRLATYWAPIPFSLLAYRYVDRKSLI